jgi:hypothetical protein
VFDHSRTDYPLQGRHATVPCAKCHTSGKSTDPLRYARCTDCHTDFHKGQFAAREDGGHCESCHTVETLQPSLYGLAEHEKSDYPLTGSHLATPCFKCHLDKNEPSNNIPVMNAFTLPDMTCKACHADIHDEQADAWIVKEGCEYCHNTLGWHETKFDHNLSQFKLTGRHGEVSCLKCHQVDSKNRMGSKVKLKPLPLECSRCHDDAHVGQFRLADGSLVDCARCHTTEAWKSLIFEHNRDSKFRLDGAHAKLDCTECHVRRITIDGMEYTVYKLLGKECADCHGGKDMKNTQGK